MESRTHDPVAASLLIESAEQFAQIAGAWDDLVGRLPVPHPLLESPLIAAWLEHVAGPDERPAILVERRDGAIAAALPLVRIRTSGLGILRPLGESWGVPSELVLSPGPAEHEAAARVLAAARRLPGYDLFRAVLTSADTEGTESLLAAGGIKLVQINRLRALDLSLGFDAWYASRDGETRRTHRKFLERLGEIGPVSWEHRRTADEVEAGLDDMFVVHDARWAGASFPDKSLLATEAGRVAIRQGVVGLAERDRVRLLILRAGGRPVAFSLALVAGGVTYGYRNGQDPAPELRRCGTGLLVTLEAMRTADAERCTRFDLGPGDHKYKRALSNAETFIYEAVGIPATLRGRAAMPLVLRRARREQAIQEAYLRDDW